MASVLVRYGLRSYEKLTFKRQNGGILIAVEFALLHEKITENGQKSTVRCAVDKIGPSRKTELYGTVRTRSADKFGLPTVFKLILSKKINAKLSSNITTQSLP
jgi:hypothetical protein